MKSSRTSPLFLLFFCLSFSFSWTSLLAQERSVFDIARSGSQQEIEALYQKNPAILESIDERGSTPLLLASYRNNEAVALYLLNHTKNLNHNSGMGTALMAAVMANNSNLVGKFIEKKADLDQVDKGGKSALIYAAFFNRNPIVKLLVDAGANRNIKDIDSRTALDYATFSKNTEAIIYLSN
jgi:ankyrin repeat protein